MYSNKKSILQLIALLKAYDIKHIVVSPGARNAPIVESLKRDEYFNCYSIVDERSAAYFAIGLIMKINKPVGVCCTSGTAVLNCGPAVAEAFYQGLPLLMITADRWQYLLGQAEDQMIPQEGIFQNFVRRSVNLPEMESDYDVWYCNRIINEALLELDHHGRGPVHINIPLSGKMYDFSAGDLPKARKINRCTDLNKSERWTQYSQKIKTFRKILMVYGQSFPPTRDEIEGLDRFCQKYNCAILADHLSNLHHKNIIRKSSVIIETISDIEKREIRPELVITTNGNTLEPVKAFLTTYPPKEHWHVSLSGSIVDQYKCLTDVFECNPVTFFKLIDDGSEQINDSSYLEEWQTLSKRIMDPMVPYSDVFAVGELIHSLPKGSSLHLANSNSVRLAQLFTLDESITVYCNRGTNGIDGSLSTATGFAADNEKLTFLIIGDLSFFYDMNGIWNRHVSKNLRIMLNNNGGAGIFQYTMEDKNLCSLDTTIAAPHATSAKAWATAVGFDYFSATNEAELRQSMAAFTGDSENPVILEVFTSKENNSRILKNYYREQTHWRKKLDPLTKLPQKIGNRIKRIQKAL